MKLRSKGKPALFVFIMSMYIIIGINSEVYSASDSLKYITHSFVKIKTKEGKVIYIDPYSVNDFTDSADVVLITHEHTDHNEIGRVRQKTNCLVVRAGSYIVNGVYQNFTVGNIKIKSVAAYNGNHSKSSCVGYVIEFNNIKIYHSGDTGNIIELADLTSQKITYALLPMDGIYTMSPEVATQAAAVVNAKFDIPIHTMPPVDTYSDAIVARFTSPNKLIVKPGKTIELKSVVTGVLNNNELPTNFKLLQNFPNPFNPYTIISWSITFGTHVLLRVYDSIGREVVTLVNEYKNAGNYHSPFSVQDIPYNKQGLHSSSGVYYYTLTTSLGTISKKMILLK